MANSYLKTAFSRLYFQGHIAKLHDLKSISSSIDDNINRDIDFTLTKQSI